MQDFLPQSETTVLVPELRPARDLFELRCSRCSSDQMQRLEVLYENGTSNSTAQSLTTGGLAGAGFGGGAAVTRTSGTTQSKAAKRAAPPAKEPVAGPVILMVLGLSLLLMHGALFFTLLALVMAGLGGYLMVKRVTFNQGKWPELYLRWRNSWYCTRCGGIEYRP